MDSLVFMGYDALSQQFKGAWHVHGDFIHLSLKDP